MAAPTLTTARLTLRPARVGDNVAIADLANDYEVVRWLARLPFPYTLADADAYLATAVDDPTNWAIVNGDTLIGKIGLRAPREEERVEAPHVLGYWIGRRHAGNGYASEAGAAVMAHAFDVLGADRVASYYFEGNAASARILEKLGFRVVGHTAHTSAVLGGRVPTVELLAERPLRGQRGSNRLDV